MISALTFLLGCFAMLLGIVFLWVYLVMTAAEWNLIAGWLLFVGSILSVAVYKSSFERPWQGWFLVWRWADSEIDKRLVSRGGD